MRARYVTDTVLALALGGGAGQGHNVRLNTVRSRLSILSAVRLITELFLERFCTICVTCEHNGRKFEGPHTWMNE